MAGTYNPTTGKWTIGNKDTVCSISQAVYGTTGYYGQITAANGISKNTTLSKTKKYGTNTTKGVLTIPDPSIVVSQIPKYSLITEMNAKAVGVVLFKLATEENDASSSTNRNMYATWIYGSFSNGIYNSYSGRKYSYTWYQDLGDGRGWVTLESQTDVTNMTSEVTCDNNAIKVRLKIKPTYKDSKKISNPITHNLVYDFRNNPPSLPQSDPSVSYNIVDGKLSVEFTNIQSNINCDKLEIAIYKDYNDMVNPEGLAYTGSTTINETTHYAKWVSDKLDPGHFYSIMWRSSRTDTNNLNNGNPIVSDWSGLLDLGYNEPIPPSKIELSTVKYIEQSGSETYGVLCSWEKVNSAKTYTIRYATSKEYLYIDGLYSEVTTTEQEGTSKTIIINQLGHTYYFLVYSNNNSYSSTTFSEVNSVTIGKKPDAPTTSQSTSKGKLGENITLFWYHNSTDGSSEENAKLHFNITALDETTPIEFDVVISNNPKRTEEYGTYIINSNNTDIIGTTGYSWNTLLSNGCRIKWKASTSGVSYVYSDNSIEREITIYTNPNLGLNLTDSTGRTITSVTNFPFFITCNASPSTQIPISYYVEIVSNNAYTSVDEVGNTTSVKVGDKIFSKYYDPQLNKWSLHIEMEPSDIIIQNGISYTINSMVSMNSGLVSTSTLTFDTELENNAYDVGANIDINKDMLEAYINPYCYTYTLNEGVVSDPIIVQDAILSVYRKNYDSSFTLIADNLENIENQYITDPHPSLDYARYRIIAKTSDGQITYKDIDPIKVSVPYIVIQWDDDWSTFIDTKIDGNAMNEEIYNTSQQYAGSMLKLPYNIDTTENNSHDVELVEYIGRKHPVSYYGTQLGISASWSTEIPLYDKETLYSLRRLSNYVGDVYVREPNGVGYWANITVSFNITHNQLTIPISFEIRKVEGGA